jgi:beta-lactamase class A
MLTLILAATLTLPPQKSDAILGVSAIHLESGKRVSVRGSARFPMGSVYQFPIGLTVLKRVDAGTLDLNSEVTIQPRDFAPGWSPIRDQANGKPVTLTIGQLLEAMVKMSDNTASDALLKLVGGPSLVTARLVELNAPPIRVDRSETQMSVDLHAPNGVDHYAADPRDTATPDAMADLFVTFWNKSDGLSPNSHALLLEHMTKSTTGPRKLRSILPSGWTLAHKTGSMPGTSNDAGILTSADGKEHIVVAIFTRAAKTSNDVTVDADIANAARAVLDALRK